jgi:hypothetical protein
MQIPYTKEAIIECMSQVLPDQSGDLEAWIDKEFERFSQLGRKLPVAISLNTLHGKWLTKYKRRGGNGGDCANGRVICSAKGL